MFDVCFFSTMPEIHINGRSSSHNSSLEIDDFGTSYVTSSGQLVTTESYISTIVISSATNTSYSDSFFGGIVLLILYFCFVLVIMIIIAICLSKRRQQPTTQWKTWIETVITNGVSISSQCHLILTNTIILSKLPQFTTI